MKKRIFWVKISASVFAVLILVGGGYFLARDRAVNEDEKKISNFQKIIKNACTFDNNPYNGEVEINDIPIVFNESALSDIDVFLPDKFRCLAYDRDNFYFYLYGILPGQLLLYDIPATSYLKDIDALGGNLIKSDDQIKISLFENDFLELVGERQITLKNGEVIYVRYGSNPFKLEEQDEFIRQVETILSAVSAK